MSGEVGGWIDWSGGVCPVEPHEWIQFRNRSRPELASTLRQGRDLDWAHRPSFSNLDIVAYRKEPK